ncbi:hypothetical protein GPECTOR_1053g329 [Gonium pectorale]|uniref:Uncharacterized protein n=1 Tax=Gonium pectorale TaxID=33097 RepID=A0A150FTP2_GONPE|nr:hypothetical protein GPECTOR_1053g329 [Gonium pectorale]|eukprot:KXZ40983.1 hypothetical protein GPECTOR_1053g329 [Gonium pectorale]
MVVVEQASATLQWENNHNVYIYADHIEVCKPSSPLDTRFTVLVQFIRELTGVEKEVEVPTNYGQELL